MSSKLLSLLVFLLSLGGAQAVCATGQYEVSSCAVHDNWRLTHLGAHVEISLGSVNYGGITSDWMTCVRSCHNNPACLQVVWVKSTRNCYGMSATSAVDQDGIGGSNVNYISAICNKAPTDPTCTPQVERSGGCVQEAHNLGTGFNTPLECLLAAKQTSGCGTSIMWSPSYGYSWGCRCCSEEVQEPGIPNDNWQLIRCASTTTNLKCVPFTACDDDQYEAQGPTHFSDRKCEPFPECGDAEYFDAQATETIGRICKPVTLCTAEQQYESVAPTQISDRECKPVTRCTAEQQYESEAPTKISDRICKPVTLCTAEQQYESVAPTQISDRECKPVTLCTAEQQYESEAPTKISDRKCKPFPECADGQYFDAWATETTGRICKPVTLCTIEQQYESDAPTEISDRKCKPFSECADGQYFDAWATETTGRICKLTTVCTGDAPKELEAPTKTSDRKCGSRHDADYPNTCWFIEKNSDKGAGDKISDIGHWWSNAVTVGISSKDTWTTARCRRFRGYSNNGKAELLCGSLGREGDPQVCSMSVCHDKCKSIGTDGCCQYIKPKVRRLSLADARLSTLV